MVETVEILAGEAVLDHGLYPRTQVNPIHVNDLANALRAGSVLPPVILDQASYRVIDGFHRTTATLRVHGPEGRLAAELRDYADEREMFLESVRLNATHGQPLTPYDRTRIISVGRQLEIEESLLAESLSVPLERLGRLEARRNALGPSGQSVPLKGSVPHLHGKPVSDKQMAAIERSSGMKLTFHVNQILLAIAGDLVNTESPVVMEKLQQLKEALESYLTPTAIR
jgi:hypothetical protein